MNRENILHGESVGAGVFDTLDPDNNHFNEYDFNNSSFKNIDQFLKNNS